MSKQLALACAIAMAVSFGGIGQVTGGELTLHPYHVSLSEIERNENTGNFEVSLCVWPADLEKALAQMTDKPVDLDHTEGLDKLIEKYLAKTVAFTSAEGAKAKIRFVGHEIDLQKGWLYFEVQTGVESDDWTFQNRVFFELNDDQINHFNFKATEFQSDACTAEKPRIVLN
jgi:hypothetical protein